MITSKESIHYINAKKTHLDNLGIGLTRRCPLECKHCSKDEPEPIDMHPDIPGILFDQFESVGRIILLGGEPTKNPSGLETICNSVFDKNGKQKVGFSSLGCITNGIEFPDDFYRILQYMGKLSHCQILVTISNDKYHDAEYKRLGIEKEQIAENIEKARLQYSHVKFTPDPLGLENDLGKEELWYMGRAKLLADNPDIVFKYAKPENDWPIFRYHDFFGPTIDEINVNEKGYVIPSCDIEHKMGDKINFGNIFKTPLKDILIQHCIEKP